MGTADRRSCRRASAGRQGTATRAPSSIRAVAIGEDGCTAAARSPRAADRRGCACLTWRV
eukprot:scaffold54757_cov71-Phaeocystis_antarctica.AAC.3